MTIAEIHFLIKNKINKLDSNQNRNLPPITIDFAINEAISAIINSLFASYYESSWYKNALSSYVKKEVLPQGTLATNDLVFDLPTDYRFYLPSQIKVVDDCNNKVIDLIEEQRQDMNNSFSSFSTNEKWGLYYVNLESNKLKIRDINNVNYQIYLSYICQPVYAHFAEATGTSGYIKDQQTLTGRQETDLPEFLHEELVRLTVLILTQGITPLDYSINKDLLSLSNTNQKQ